MFQFPRFAWRPYVFRTPYLSRTQESGDRDQDFLKHWTYRFNLKDFLFPDFCLLCPEKVGFPIRKSTDQRVLASPRGLSQPITSFIASQCQGIHKMPLCAWFALSWLSVQISENRNQKSEFLMIETNRFNLKNVLISDIPISNIWLISVIKLVIRD